MFQTRRCSLLIGSLAVLAWSSASIQAQYRQEPGRSIGTITTSGSMIIMTLDEGVLGKPNLFNLAHHTVRFTPDGAAYRIENLSEVWDPEFGAPLTQSEVTLKSFAFPFSGKTYSSFSVGVTGSLVFGEQPAGEPRGGGGLSVDRFAELQTASSAIINTVPAISVFFKPRMSGTRFVKELGDKVVITWNLTEPVGNVQDMTWKPTVNKFQAVLHKDGEIDLSYEEVSAQDSIVGVYPMVTKGAELEISTLIAEANATAAPHLNIKSVKLTAVDRLFLKATIETRGPVLPETDPAVSNVIYRICLDRKKPTGDCTTDVSDGVVWSVHNGRFGPRGGGGRGTNAAPRYFATGSGVSSTVKVEGNTISVQGALPEGYKAGDEVYVSAAVQSTANPSMPTGHLQARSVKLSGLNGPAVHLSAINRGDGPFPVVYEAFHYLKPPRAADLTCTVIKALGDKFDMLAYYSDFRIDNPEAGTSSTGPLGGGPDGGAVTGIGANQRNLSTYCTQGRFQWQFIQPVFVGANQMQEYPPDGLTDTDPRNIVSYTSLLEERTSNGKIPPYDYAMSQIGHEMGHRWSAFVSAKVNDETIQLGPTHWAKGLQAPVAFPYQRPVEASAMGGGVWQDNYDGTFTQLDDDYYVPATGWSYLDLYLMGFISVAEVPDFFILRNLVPAGRDTNGHAIYKADRTKITIQDVIAAEGPRLPDVGKSQKNFNTGMVVVVEHGKTPSPELIERTNGIRERWMDYWSTTTGHRSTMTTNP
jgi:hypothetical protein